MAKRHADGSDDTAKLVAHALRPPRGLGLGHRPEQHHARVVRQNVEAAPLRHRLLGRGLGSMPVGDVGLGHQRPAAAVQVGRELLQPVRRRAASATDRPWPASARSLLRSRCWLR